jgi:antitoxin ParD1/3/4
MANMETMNIALTAEQKAWVKEQAARDGYVNVSEFMRGMIREAQRKLAKARLEESLLEALKEEPSPFTDADWDWVEAEGKRLAAERIASAPKLRTRASRAARSR